MKISHIRNEQDAKSYFNELKSKDNANKSINKDTKEVVLKEIISKVPEDERTLLTNMDKDHNGKLSFQEFMASVQSQLGVSKPTTAASKLGIVTPPNADSPGMKVMNILKGLYDVVTGPGLVAQEVPQSNSAPVTQTPAAPPKTVNTVAVPAAPAKTNEAPAKTDKADAKLSELEVYGRVANGKPIVGLSWVDAKD
jgi:hypothetical protein